MDFNGNTSTTIKQQQILMYYWCCCCKTFCWHVFKYKSVSCPFMLFYCPSLKISLNPLHDNEGSQSSHVIVVLRATCLRMSSCPRARIHHSSQVPSAGGQLCKDKYWPLGAGSRDRLPSRSHSDSVASTKSEGKACQESGRRPRTVYLHVRHCIT